MPIDPETGELIEDGDCPRCRDLRGELAAAHGDIEELERDLTAKRRQLTAVKNQTKRDKQRARDAEVIERIAQYWRDKTGHPRAKVTLEGVRAEALWDRLVKDEFSEDDIKRAIDGCAAFPFVGQGGRVRRGTPEQRHDDLELICRDEKKVEAFIALADRDARERAEREDGPPGHGDDPQW